jgi:hypothetical protein
VQYGYFAEQIKTRKFALNPFDQQQQRLAIDVCSLDAHTNQIEDKDTEPTTIQGEVIKVDSFRVKRFSSRFYGINVKSGDLSHYSDIIVDTKDDLKIKKNPRKNTQIELDNQYLLLIDTKEKNVYLSNSKKKVVAQKLLTDKTGKNVVIEEILSKEVENKRLKVSLKLNRFYKNSTKYVN